MNLLDAIALIKHGSISEKSNARWADLGCGSGLFTFALANLLQNESIIYAVDKTIVSFQKLFNPNKINIHTKQMDFTKESLPFNNLDGIMMGNSLHFVHDKFAFIASASKQLSGDGSFLIVEYNTDKPNRWVPYPASSRSLQLLFAEAGYHFFEKLNETPSLYNTGSIYSALIKK